MLANATNCYAYSGGYGNCVRVGIIDSGIDAQSVRVADGYNFLDDSNDITDNKGHGTKIAQIVSEIVPKAELVALKCTEKDLVTDNSSIIKAIYQSKDKYNCDVLNISIGMPDSEELKKAIDYVTQKGVIVVSAVGNDGEISYKKGKIYYPAGYENTIGVGAVDEQNVVCGYSQKNNSVFITIKSLEGTSFAAAKITGAAAVAKSFDKRITPTLFMEFLKKNAKDCGIEGFDTSYGYGVFDFTGYEKSLIDRYSLLVTEQTEDSVTVCNLSDKEVSTKLVFGGNMPDSKEILLKPSESTVIDIKNTSKCFIWQDSIFNIVWIKKGEQP